MKQIENTPIYPRITEWAGYSFCCDDRLAICPDCGWKVCVFCQIECEGCLEEIF